jgi:gp20|nr:MAG TPA: N-acetylmuramoyl-L-alanine amidase [Caudoviricetes sp.]
MVIHTMEAPEGPQTAENVARYFASGQVVASAHMCVDQDSVVYCLPASAVAFAAPGCNHDGYQVEHAGYARQSPEEWGDAASVAMLQLSAQATREIADSLGIPLRHLTDDELAAGMSGFVGHDQVSRVYKRSDHTDPGPSFPWSYYMGLVTGESAQLAIDTTEGENDMQFVRSKQTNTIYAVTPYTVTAMTSAKVWQDTVKAFGLSEEYTVSLDDGDIAAIAADCAARRQVLVSEIAAALKAGD